MTYSGGPINSGHRGVFDFDRQEREQYPRPKLCYFSFLTVVGFETYAGRTLPPRTSRPRRFICQIIGLVSVVPLDTAMPTNAAPVTVWDMMVSEVSPEHWKGYSLLDTRCFADSTRWSIIFTQIPH